MSERGYEGEGVGECVSVSLSVYMYVCVLYRNLHQYPM